MKTILKAAGAVLAAFLIYTLMGKAGAALLLAVNAFSVIVLVFAVREGEVFGAALGTVCGLLQDSFSLGVFGVAGLTKTLLGFAAGLISRKIHVAPFFRNFVFIFILATVEIVLWVFLYSLIFSEKVVTRGGFVFFQPLTTAVLVSGVLALLRKIKTPEP
jgi:rod shape-determining protein MreD